MSTPPGAGIVLPVRAFAGGLGRLAPRLGPGERADLARRFADRLVAAAGELPVVVVTSAPEVEEWAAELDIATVADPGSLDGAAAAGRSYLAEHGSVRAVVAHADLPFARTLDAVAGDGAEPVMAIVACHRDDGTPVLSVPVTAPFRFAYGVGSFRRHLEEGLRLGLTTRVVHDPDLAFDVDVPADLDQLAMSDWS